MNEKFFDLAREKQDRMINGAIEVFAKNGYKHASTDDMVKTVGVSKGLWFHYFGSKVGRSYPYLTIFLEEAAHEPEQALAVKTAASRQSYEERLDAYLKHAEIDNVSDKGRRERIKKMLEYTISGIIREKTAQAAETDAIFREIKAYIDLVRDMALSLP